MSEQVKVYADVGLDSNLLFNTSNNDFPENPSVGLFTIVNQVLYGYLRIGGMTTWYPFSSVRQSYVHTQETPSLVWTVVHNLNSENVWYQIQDTSGNLVMASKREIDANSFQLLFTVERAGTCLVVGPDVIDVPQVLASVLNIGGGAVMINSSGITINGVSVVTNDSITTQITAAIDALPNPSVSLGLYANITALNTAYPAASNANNVAIIGTAAPYVLCTSNGTEWLGSGKFSTLTALQTYITNGIPAGIYQVGQETYEYDGTTLLLGNIESAPVYGTDGSISSITVDGVTTNFTYGTNSITVNDGVTKTVITNDTNGILQSINKTAV